MKTGRHAFASLPWWSRIPTLADIKHEPVSWLALDLARAVALGQNFAQMGGSAAREVLYIDQENGPNLIAHRREILGIPDTPKLR